jgi:hypothetical protein
MGNASCCHYCAKEDEERTLLTHVRGPSEKDHAHVYNLHSEVKMLTENQPTRNSSLLEVPGNRFLCDDDVGGGGTECMLLFFSLTAYTPYPHGRVSICLMCTYTLQNICCLLMQSAIFHEPLQMMHSLTEAIAKGTDASIKSVRKGVIDSFDPVFKQYPATFRDWEH